MKNKIATLFATTPGRLLNVYFTAGFPELNATATVLQTLQEAGADLVEIGMPYSDPLADGPTIQQSNTVALRNGMSIKQLLAQLAAVRETVTLPIILMGYLNPVLQYGFENFCRDAARVGIDGLILPDMPLPEYEAEYQPIFDRYNLSAIFLITPQTSEARIRRIDELTNSFIYLVSTASTTGNAVAGTDQQLAYFERIKQMNLKNPKLIGFGIGDKKSFDLACRYAEGAIIGSAFIKVIQQPDGLEENIRQFIHQVKSGEIVLN